MAEQTKTELVRTLGQHTRKINEFEGKLDNLNHARDLVMLHLHLDHGVTMRELGEEVGLTSASVMLHLRKVGLEKGQSPSKTGPKPTERKPTERKTA